MKDVLYVMIALLVGALCVYLIVIGWRARQAAKRRTEAGLAAEEAEARRWKERVLGEYTRRLQAIEGIRVTRAGGTFAVSCHLDIKSRKERVAALRDLERDLAAVQRELSDAEKEIQLRFSNALEMATMAQKPALVRSRDGQVAPYEMIKSRIKSLMAEMATVLAEDEKRLAQEAARKPKPVRRPVAESSPQQPVGDIAAQISKLAQLWYGGILTDEEFEEAKDELLSRI